MDTIDEEYEAIVSTSSGSNTTQNQTDSKSGILVQDQGEDKLDSSFDSLLLVLENKVRNHHRLRTKRRRVRSLDSRAISTSSGERIISTSTELGSSRNISQGNDELKEEHSKLSTESSAKNNELPKGKGINAIEDKCMFIISIPYFSITAELTESQLFDAFTVTDLKIKVADVTSMPDFATYHLFATDLRQSLDYIKDSTNLRKLQDILKSNGPDYSLILVDSVVANVYSYNNKVETLQCLTFSIDPLSNLLQFYDKIEAKLDLKKFGLHFQGIQITDFGKYIYEFANQTGVNFMLFPKTKYKIVALSNIDSQTALYLVNCQYSIYDISQQIALMKEDASKKRHKGKESELEKGSSPVTYSTISREASLGSKDSETFYNSKSEYRLYGLDTLFTSSNLVDSSSFITIYLKLDALDDLLLLDIESFWTIHQLENHIRKKLNFSQDLSKDSNQFYCLIYGDIYLLDKARTVKNYGIFDEAILHRGMVVTVSDSYNPIIQKKNSTPRKLARFQVSMIILLLILIVLLMMAVMNGEFIANWSNKIGLQSDIPIDLIPTKTQKQPAFKFGRSKPTQTTTTPTRAPIFQPLLYFIIRKFLDFTEFTER